MIYSMEIKFGERLKELRLEKNLSTRSLAKAVNTSNANISNWENGKVYPTIYFLFVLCDYFNVSADYLLGREI